ncbi:MAG TPA: alpha/beta hydrolase fold domain-containing protein [Chitinophagaceae bacterium]|jgi:acetyl esterase/lipase
MEDKTIDNIIADRTAFDNLGNIYPPAGNVEISDELIENVSCYWFVPDNYDKKKVVVYLHGGMFVLGSIKGYKAMISHFAAAFSTRILFIEYSLAPEKPFPAAANDIFKVYLELTARYPSAKFTVMGDSAGGGLAATFIKMLAENKLQMPSGVILISPWIYLTGNTKSYETRSKLDPILTKDKLLEYANYYVADKWKEADPGQFTFNSFPPLSILVGSNEILFDDATLFYEKIRLLQPLTQMKEYENQIHGFPLIDINSEASKEALANMEMFIYQTSR